MRKLDQALHIERAVLIQPSGYGTDNSCLLDGLKQLGSKSRGVVAIDEKTNDKALDDMDRVGVRGIRLNTGQNVSEARGRLRDAAQRLAGRKWHINTALQLPILEGLQEDIMGLPVPLVIDHYAGSHAANGIHQPGFDVLLKLLKGGNIYVKLSRLHNVSTQAPGYADVEPLAKALMAANSQRLLWGTDWPHAGIRPPGYKPTDISPYLQYDDGLIFNEFAAWAVEPARRQTILVDNPARLYGFSG
jgi:predicted TIM-barrel fold metal-dependent hydrolase